jgi:hypothetical protein
MTELLQSLPKINLITDTTLNRHHLRTVKFTTPNRKIMTEGRIDADE